MRVLIVADIVGGVRTFVRELTGGLAGRGIEVDLALLGSERAAAGLTAIGARTVETRELRLEWMEDPWADVERTAEWVESLRARHAPDVIHMNTFAPVLDDEVPVLLSVHSCVRTWWRAVHGVEAPAAWERYTSLAADALARADLVTAPTRALLDELQAVYGPIRTARVIPNGRDVGDDAPLERERLVVSAGRLWDEAKNASLLARAAPLIEGRVVLVGPGMVPGVESTGQLDADEVRGWMRRAAVFAEPARYEPFGLAALEAALSGCALVLGDIPSLREVWGGGATYVDPDDLEGLAAAVNALLRDPARRHRAALAARSVARRYTPAAMSDGYVAVLRRLARDPVAA